MNGDSFYPPSPDRFSYQESLDRMGARSAPEGSGPGRARYLLGVLVILAGVGAFLYFLLTGIFGMKDALTQVVVPGGKVLALEQPGKHTVFFEYRSVVEGKVYSSGQGLAGLSCSVRDLAAGEWIELKIASVNSNYKIGGRAGFAVYEFKIERPGEYEFACRYPEGQEGPEAVMAIGRGFVKKLLFNIFKSIGVLMAGLFLGIGIIVQTSLKRSRSLAPPERKGPLKGKKLFFQGPDHEKTR